MRATIRHWVGLKLPSGYIADEEREFSAWEIMKLFEAGYDVMLHNVCTGSGRKRKIVSTIIYLDECGRSFHQR